MRLAFFPCKLTRDVQSFEDVIDLAKRVWARIRSTEFSVLLILAYCNAYSSSVHDGLQIVFARHLFCRISRA